ncbi:hypothetical protein ACFWGP_09940 [Agromyces sp. NPDC127015]|uniref:hypothetical protein n=1 Tax=Agromyces sp. NPDC127015 TaxID=3347108 RepID=UPI0036671E54
MPDASGTDRSRTGANAAQAGRAAPTRVRHRTIRIILTAVWILFVIYGMWLIFIKSFAALFRVTPVEPEGAATAYVAFAVGAGLVAAAAVITLFLGAPWWQALMIAVPAFCFPVGLITENIVIVWALLGFGVITAAMGGTGAVLATFRIPLR